MTLEALRTRLWYKALDAVMTASVRPRRQRGEYLRNILSPRSSNYGRVASLVGLIDTLVPGTGRRASGYLLRPDFMPFSGAGIELMDSGSGSTVFLLQTGGDRSVLKAYRRTLGRGRDSLLELAAIYRKKYQTVSSWYAGKYEIVVPADFLLLQGPMLGLPVVACLQPYIEGETRDVFADFDDDDLVRFMRANHGFKEQFTFFARRTLDVYAKQKSCVDLLGTNNLMVTREGEFWALKLIDYGIFDLEALQDEAPGVFSRLSNLISRLQSLLDSVAVATEDSGSGRPVD